MNGLNVLRVLVVHSVSALAFVTDLLEMLGATYCLRKRIDMSSASASGAVSSEPTLPREANVVGAS